MDNRMLVCDALDERDFLAKKIADAINSAHFIGVKRKKDEKVFGCNLSAEEFGEKARKEYQSITDMIKRYNSLDIAIVRSNAETIIQTKSGKEMTVAAAITLRKTFNSTRDFTGLLIERFSDNIEGVQAKKGRYDSSADDELVKYKNSLVGKSGDRVLSEDEVRAVESMTEGLYGEIIDPINAVDKLDSLSDDYYRLKKELDTAIKVSNATTYIVIQ